MSPLVDPAFWRGRKVLVTGHTGFKGAWLTLWLHALGAHVTGLSDAVRTTPSLFELARVGELVDDIRADVRDHRALAAAFAAHEPEIVVHMAAQAFVRRSFADPRATYETNVMGTVNVLETVRATPSVRAVVNVTSDKCYDNRGGRRAFVEDDPKGGHDPYSSSKGCAELVADAYGRSFFAPVPDGPRLGSARAGNVIGGGDWGEDRLIPDVMRGALAGVPIRIRNPESVRPWQHVLNPLSGYLALAQALHADAAAQGGWNFGPAPGDARPVSWLADRLTQLWPAPLRWEVDPGPHPHEAGHLALDSTKARERLGWAPAWDLDDALGAVVAWYDALRAGEDMRAVTLAQIEAFAAAGVSPAARGRRAS
jgi:CDP-glucose 4,6-dehydratase